MIIVLLGFAKEDQVSNFQITSGIQNVWFSTTLPPSRATSLGAFVYTAPRGYAADFQFSLCSPFKCKKIYGWYSGKNYFQSVFFMSCFGIEPGRVQQSSIIPAPVRLWWASSWTASPLCSCFRLQNGLWESNQRQAEDFLRASPSFRRFCGTYPSWWPVDVQNGIKSGCRLRIFLHCSEGNIPFHDF